MQEVKYDGAICLSILPWRYKSYKMGDDYPKNKGKASSGIIDLQHKILLKESGSYWQR